MVDLPVISGATCSAAVNVYFSALMTGKLIPGFSFCLLFADKKSKHGYTQFCFSG